MKTTGKTTICALLIGCFAVTAAACGEQKKEEAFDTALPVNFSLNEKGEYVNPLIYGQFIEHIETCIYDGIWSEKVLDRKFYYEVGASGLSPWKTTDASLVSSDAETSYSGGHSAYLRAGGDIYQEDVSVEEKGYEGYFYCLSPAGCTVTVSLEGENGSAETTVAVAAGSQFVRYEYSLKGTFKTTEATYRLKVTQGEGRFDSLSLMPEDNYLGMRLDTLEELKELNSPIYRWPGGNFLSGYDWRDGIGDRDKRPSRRNLNYMGLESDFASEEAMITSDIVNLKRLGFYGGIEPNDFGLDEFMAMCDYLGAEALMMVNTGLGTFEEAVQQVEYCNGAVSTEYGALRAANGHEEPYGIRYWGVGNEMFGDWQLGHVPVSEYVNIHNAFTKAMREVDPDILIVASGENSSTWSDSLFASCGNNMDFIAEHMYAQQDNVDVFEHLANMRTNIEYRISNHRQLLAKYPQYGDVKIAFTEYAYDKATSASRLKDGMGIGVFLNAVINNSDVFEMCCYSSTVNATQGCVTTEPFGAVTQGAGYVLGMYRNYMFDYRVESVVRYSEALQLDVSVTRSEDGSSYAIAVVNPSEYAVKLTNAAFDSALSVERTTLTGDYYDSYNSTARSEMWTERVENLKNVVAPAMSVSVFVVKVR